MVNQYPHYLFKTSAQEGYLSKGQWRTRYSAEAEYLGVCRYEISSKSRVIVGGENISNNATIYMPLDTISVEVGEEITVCKDREGKEVLYKGECQLISEGQLNKRIIV